jgi:type IV secretion system protein VirB10
MNAESVVGVPGELPPEGDVLTPLPGEPGIPNVAAPSRASVSKKGLLAVVLLVASLAVVSGLAIHRFASGARKDATEDKLLRDKPAAAGTQHRRLEMPTAASTASSPSATLRVPALLPNDDEQAEPIGVRRTGVSPSPGSGPAQVSPLDAPVLLVSTRPLQATASGAAHRAAPDRQAMYDEVSSAPDDAQDPLASTSRNLQAYQRQLQGLLDSLTRSAELATGGNASTQPAPSMPALSTGPLALPNAQPHVGLLGGQMQGSVTAKVAAGSLGNRSLTLAKGTAFTCALKTRIISATSGLVGCQVQRNVYGDDGRVLLIERGSHLDGEYRIAAVRAGMVRIPVLWTRIRTPLGVTVDIESPATGQLGESGVDGYVDNRWTERIGAAMLLSLIDDSVKMVIQSQANERQGDTIVLPSTTANTSRLAEKVLDSTINIPPLIYQNQGGIVGIYVARDVDFSSVYELRPTASTAGRP